MRTYPVRRELSLAGHYSKRESLKTELEYLQADVLRTFRQYCNSYRLGRYKRGNPMDTWFSGCVYGQYSGKLSSMWSDLHDYDLTEYSDMLATAAWNEIRFLLRYAEQLDNFGDKE